VVQEDQIMLFDDEECTGDFITVRAPGEFERFDTSWFESESSNYGKGSWANRINSVRLPRRVSLQLYEHEVDEGLVTPGEFIGDTHTEYVCQDMNGWGGRSGFMQVYNWPDLEYFHIELFKTSDCTGEAFVDGLKQRSSS